ERHVDSQAWSNDIQASPKKYPKKEKNQKFPTTGSKAPPLPTLRKRAKNNNRSFRAMVNRMNVSCCRLERSQIPYR
ncbi:hypothetical protein OFM52_31395, partial [Escherichia coli]|nr:hypothetical protein [Escherichia coli]